jgi:hypothetical protein
MSSQHEHFKNKKMIAMKNIALLLIALLPVIGLTAQNNHLPDIDLRDLDGKVVSASTIADSGQATLLVFWRSSSNKCCENLGNIQEAWIETLRGRGVKMIAICIDCNGSWTHVKPLVNGRDWEFETFIDVNGDFKRAMSISDAPCSLLFDEDQNLVYWYNAAYTGTQDFICQNIMEHLENDQAKTEFMGYTANK